MDRCCICDRGINAGLFCVVCSQGLSIVNGLKALNCRTQQLQTDQANTYKTMVSKWVCYLKHIFNKEANENVRFLRELAHGVRDQNQTDILLCPGDNEPPIPVQRIFLTSRSEIFKDIVKACDSPLNDTIPVPELKHEELESFLEFLCNAYLSEEKMKKHVYSLTIAADKYAIPYLQKVCENHMEKSLSSSNALDVLKVADMCSGSQTTLKQKALEFITKNMDDIIFSTKYETFALENPHLCVQISWGLAKRIKTI